MDVGVEWLGWSCINQKYRAFITIERVVPYYWGIVLGVRRLIQDRNADQYLKANVFTICLCILLHHDRFEFWKCDKYLSYPNERVSLFWRTFLLNPGLQRWDISKKADPQVVRKGCRVFNTLSQRLPCYMELFEYLNIICSTSFLPVLSYVRWNSFDAGGLALVSWKDPVLRAVRVRSVCISKLMWPDWGVVIANRFRPEKDGCRLLELGIIRILWGPYGRI